VHPENAKIIAQLEEAISGLDRRSASDYPFETFAWEISEKGEFTIENLLLANGMMTKVDIEQYTRFITSEINWEKYSEYYSSVSISQESLGERHRKVLDFLKLNLSTFEIYLLKNPDSLPLFFNDYQIDTLLDSLNELSESGQCRGTYVEACYVLMGCTKDNNWIGLVPKMACDGYVYRKNSLVLLNSTEFPASDETLALKAQVEALVNDLESPVTEFLEFYRYNTHVIEVENSRQSLLENLLLSVGFSRICKFDNLSRNWEEYSAENCLKMLTKRRNEDRERLQATRNHYGNSVNLDQYITSQKSAYEAEVQSLQELQKYYERLVEIDQILISRLTDLREYIFGFGAVFHFYDIGKSPTGDWLGVKSICIST
jgi:Nuclease A inhibitor-like protein